MSQKSINLHAIRTGLANLAKLVCRDNGLPNVRVYVDIEHPTSANAPHQLQMKIIVEHAPDVDVTHPLVAPQWEDN